MITQIKTKELWNLVSDLRYQGHKIEMSSIAHELNNPQDLFSPGGNSLYKNLALYIINHQSPCIIPVDLDKSQPIDSGLFEYIKSIYKKDDFVYVEIPETGNNLLLIKMKNLMPLEVEMKTAFNDQMVGADSIFKQVSPESKAKFFWQTDRVDLYTSEDWVLNKIKQDLKKVVPFQKNPIDDTIEKISGDVFYSESFNLALLALHQPHLNKLIATQDFEIDFNLPIFENVVLEQIKNNDLDLLKSLFEHKSTQCNMEKLLNQDNVVEHFLKEKNNYSVKSNDSFSIYNVFYYFNPDNKRKCVHNYLECIKEADMVKPYYSESYIFQIPDYLLNEEKVLSFILPHVGEERLSLNLSKIKNPLIKDKNFILSVADKLSAHKLNSVIDKFIDHADIDFLTQCVEKNPSYYTQLDAPHHRLHHLLNLELAMLATSSKNNISLSSLAPEPIMPYLLQEGTPREEKFKRDFIFSNKKDFYKIAHASADKSLFLKKYNKLENFFLYSQYRTDIKAQNQISKITSPEKLKVLMDKIQSLDTSLEIDYLAFYKNMDKSLQTDIKLLKDLNLLDHIEYVHLNDILKVNKEVTIHYLGQDGIQIPEAFFNDIDFCLEYCRALDAKKVKSMPPFVSKFFDNLEISSDYYKNLNSYILMGSLNDTLEKKPETKKKKI